MIYLDSCIVIYAVEDPTARGKHLRDRLVGAGGGLTISSLVVLECLVGPIRHADELLRRRYERIFDEFSRVPLSESTLRRAAELAAHHRLRTPDAIHLAAALDGGCDELWTNDNRLARAAGSLARNVW